MNPMMMGDGCLMPSYLVETMTPGALGVTEGMLGLASAQKNPSRPARRLFVHMGGGDTRDPVTYNCNIP